MAIMNQAMEREKEDSDHPLASTPPPPCILELNKDFRIDFERRCCLSTISRRFQVLSMGSAYSNVSREIQMKAYRMGSAEVMKHIRNELGEKHGALEFFQAQLGLILGHLIEESMNRQPDGDAADKAVETVLGIKNKQLRLDMLALFGKVLYDLEEQYQEATKAPKRKGYGSSFSCDEDSDDNDSHHRKHKKNRRAEEEPHEVNAKKRQARRTNKTRADWNEAIRQPPKSKGRRRILRRYHATTLEDAMKLPGSSTDTSSTLILANSTEVVCRICDRRLKLNNPYQPSDLYTHLDTERHYEAWDLLVSLADQVPDEEYEEREEAGEINEEEAGL